MPYRRRAIKLGSYSTAVERGDLSAVLPPDCAPTLPRPMLSPQGRVATTPVVVGMGDGGGPLFIDERTRGERVEFHYRRKYA